MQSAVGPIARDWAAVVGRAELVRRRRRTVRRLQYLGSVGLLVAGAVVVLGGPSGRTVPASSDRAAGFAGASGRAELIAGVSLAAAIAAVALRRLARQPAEPTPTGWARASGWLGVVVAAISVAWPVTLAWQHFGQVDELADEFETMTDELEIVDRSVDRSLLRDGFAPVVTLEVRDARADRPASDVASLALQARGFRPDLGGGHVRAQDGTWDVAEVRSSNGRTATIEVRPGGSGNPRNGLPFVLLVGTAGVAIAVGIVRPTPHRRVLGALLAGLVALQTWLVVRAFWRTLRVYDEYPDSSQSVEELLARSSLGWSDSDRAFYDAVHDTAIDLYPAGGAASFLLVVPFAVAVWAIGPGGTRRRDLTRRVLLVVGVAALGLAGIAFALNAPGAMTIVD